jgi:signal transduction histidine kinase
MGPIAASPVVVAHRAHGLIAVARPPGGEPFDDCDLDLLDRLAVQLGLVVQIVRSRADRQRLAVLQDRQRIARDLHDTVIQDLIGLGMHVHAQALDEGDRARRERDEDIVEHLDRTVRRLRAAVFQLRDGPLRSTATESLEQLIAESSRALDHVPSLRLAGPVDDLAPDLVHEVVTVLREALSNVARHAAATETSVTVAVDHDRVRVIVEDDGIGPGSGNTVGTGLANLRERAALHGGATGLCARPTGGARLWWECRRPAGAADHAG